MNDLTKPYYYIDGDLGIYLHIIDKDNPDNSLEIRGKLAKEIYYQLSHLDPNMNFFKERIQNMLNDQHLRQLEAEFNANLGTAVGDNIENA